MLTKDLPRNYCPGCRGHGRVFEPIEDVPEGGVRIECPDCKGTGRLTQQQKAKSPKYQPKGASKAKNGIDAVFIQESLAKKYDRLPWVYMSELRDNPGFDATRTIDGYAVHLTNQQLLAFEIKISRQDFKRDIESNKWHDWFRLSSEFYFVTPAGLLDDPDSVLPPGTGLMEMDSQGNIRKRSWAAVRTMAQVPTTLLCVLLKRAKDLRNES